MTRFARASKKTSLEATPWHELLNSSGDHGTKKKDTSSKSRKETKLTSKKRKKNLTDGGSSVPKISRKSEDKNIQSVGVEGEANVRPALKNKNNHKRSKAALNSMHDNGGIEKKKQKHGFKSDMHKNFIKKKRKLPTDGNRTESLDKKLEARRKRRAKGKACFHCRQTGHVVAECPLAQNTEMGVGNCYKCGSSEHTTKNCNNKAQSDAKTAFPFAKCFICGESGHIARTCPDNPKGLYPNGGGCKICGSVEHFRRDCPELVRHNKDSVTTTHAKYIRNKKGHYSADAELEDLEGTSCRAPKKKGPPVVKF